MNHKPPAFWTQWLLVVSIFGVTMGALMAFIPIPAKFIGPAYYNQYFGFDAYAELTEPALRFQRFIYGASGAVLVSWFIMIGWTTRRAFAEGERWAWNAILVSTLAWFLGDVYASIVSGFAVHAALNLSLLIGIGIPLAATYRSFHGADSEGVSNAVP